MKTARNSFVTVSNLSAVWLPRTYDYESVISVDAHFNVWYSQYLLPLIIVYRIIWPHWLPFCQTENQSVGKAKPSNILVWTSLILPKLIYPSEYNLSAVIVLFINNYPLATAYYAHVIYLFMKFSVKQHIEPGENLLTQSALPFLVSHVPPCFRWTDSDQPLFGLFHWPPCWANQSNKICCSTENLVLWSFRRLDAST